MQSRPLRAKFGSVLGPGDRTEDVLQEEKQRLQEHKMAVVQWHRQMLAQATPETNRPEAGMRRARLDLQEAIEDSDDLLLRCALRGL
ncbi:unnamed protein product [Effrenium voratum]|uniref:Uncharacterized protein n=1 Tax=Effrenium voratum TaxID=2562239 RepID=A0AA36JQX6_9DINO|nr:unnamed protein product [Effrenium voratum]CAJ1456471.1 unnamed protein product [Effrenium voratum]